MGFSCILIQFFPSHFKQILPFGNQRPASHLFSDEFYCEKQAPRLTHHSRVKANHLLASQMARGT